MVVSRSNTLFLFLTTDHSPWRERWGGWYVTGTHGDQPTDCVLCHDGASTGGVPGLMVRSVYPDNEGNAILRAGTFTDNCKTRDMVRF